MLINSVIRIAASLVPLLIGFFVIAVLFFTDARGAQVVFKVRLEVLVLSFCALISAVCLAISFIQRRQHKALRDQKSKHQQNSREEHQRFIRRLDHELKNPLTTIQLALENMRSNAKDARNEQSFISIEAQAARLTGLTTDLRKLAAFDHQELSLEEINIADLLNQTFELCKETGLSNDRNINLILPAAPWPVPNILGDNDLLQLALYNLIENAVKYSDSGDNVDIRASDNDSEVMIEVADTGVGILSTDIDHVWEELFRGENIRDRSGNGIGLSLVKRIIDRHHGNLIVASKEQTGTRILISLPINA